MSTRLARPMRVSRLAAELRLAWEGDDIELALVAPLSAMEPGALTFMHTARDADLAGACVIARDEPRSATAWIRSERPRLDFVKALAAIDQSPGFARPTEPARVHPSVRLGDHVSLGKGVIVGEGTRIESFVRIADGVTIGADCYIKSGSVIGEPGFGFERDVDGTPLRMLQLGGVVIGDRVEIGSLCSVASGTLRATVLEDDVKLDDHVHVAHNCRVKKKALLTACVELSGGVTIGEEAWLGPNASIIDQITIGDRAFVGIGAVVIRPVADGATVVGNPAKPIQRRSG